MNNAIVGDMAGTWNSTTNSCKCSGSILSSDGNCIKTVVHQCGIRGGTWNSAANSCDCLELSEWNGSACEAIDGAEWKNNDFQCKSDYTEVGGVVCVLTAKYNACVDSGGTWEDNQCKCKEGTRYNSDTSACSVQFLMSEEDFFADGSQVKYIAYNADDDVLTVPCESDLSTVLQNSLSEQDCYWKTDNQTWGLCDDLSYNDIKKITDGRLDLCCGDSCN